MSEDTIYNDEDSEYDNDDFYEKRIIKVDPRQSELRIDKFLVLRLENVSRTRIQNGINDGAILVNGEAIKSNYKVRPLDEILVIVPKPPSEDQPVKGEDIPLDIVYEDGHILVVNKAAGMVVHPGIGNWTGTLVNALVYYLEKSDLPILPGNRTNRPGLVHRIDKDTSGLLVIAKTDLAMDSLAKQFFDHSIDRSYHALVWGEFDHEEGTIDAPIGRNPRNRLQQLTLNPERASESELELSKHAITHYKVIEDMYYVSLVECRLETGRTHQIRSHFAHIGKPLFADHRYGGHRILKGTVFSKYKSFVENTMGMLEGQALHAYSLGFNHPETKKRVEFSVDEPPAFQKVMQRWRNYVNARKELL